MQPIVDTLSESHLAQALINWSANVELALWHRGGVAIRGEGLQPLCRVCSAYMILTELRSDRGGHLCSFGSWLENIKIVKA